MDLLYESDQKLGDLEDNMCDILDNDAFHSPSSMVRMQIYPYVYLLSQNILYQINKIYECLLIFNNLTGFINKKLDFCNKNMKHAA